jgi:hypothetical protein
MRVDRKIALRPPSVSRDSACNNNNNKTEREESEARKRWRET